MATRTQARESVVGLLYAFELGNEAIAQHIDIIFEDKKIRNKQKEFASNLFEGVIKNINNLNLLSLVIGIAVSEFLSELTEKKYNLKCCWIYPNNGRIFHVIGNSLFLIL